jgi:hypothetical protein
MTFAATDQSVVVGVRDHQTGLLEFARGLAQLFHSHLRVVHSYAPPFSYNDTTLYTAQDLSGALTPASQQVIADARAQLESSDDGPEVEYELIYG